MLAVNSKWFPYHVGQFVAPGPSEAQPSVLEEGTEVEAGKDSEGSTASPPYPLVPTSSFLWVSRTAAVTVWQAAGFQLQT